MVFIHLMTFQWVISFLSLLSWTNNPIGSEWAPAPAHPQGVFRDLSIHIELHPPYTPQH
jgi:hypothetical protein